MKSIDYILSNWLSGTTCRRVTATRRNGACDPTLVWKGDYYVALKHFAHSNYAGRFSGSVCCPAYVALYSIESFDDWQFLVYRPKPVMIWEGQSARALKRIVSEIEALGFK